MIHGKTFLEGMICRTKDKPNANTGFVLRFASVYLLPFKSARKEYLEAVVCSYIRSEPLIRYAIISRIIYEVA